MLSSTKSTWLTNLFFVTALTLILSLNAAAQSYEWVKSAGGEKGAGIYPGMIHVDAAGNSYITGAVYKHVKFDNIDIVPSTVTSYSDIFIAKYDTKGTLAWIKQDGGTGVEFAKDIVVDAQGNIYVYGFFSRIFNGATCEIGGIKLEVENNQHEYFLAKYDSKGKLLWVRQTYNSGHTIDAHGYIELDPQGNVIITGTYMGEIKFGTTTLKNDGKSYSLFIAKYSPAGIPVWATTQLNHINYTPPSEFQTADYILERSLTIDKNGNIYFTGVFKGTLDFGGKSVKSQGADIYLVKLNSNGKHLWHKVTGGVDDDYAADVEIDSKGNPYWLIYTSQPKIGAVSNSKEYGTFVAKFDQNGNPYEISSIIENGFCTAMGIDAKDRIYAIGHYSPTARVDCVVLKSTTQNNDAFFISQDAAGNLQWIKEIKGLYGIMTLDIKVDASNNAYGLGYFRGDIAFDDLNILNIGGANAEQQGLFTDDMFFAKVNNIGTYAPPVAISVSCDIPLLATVNSSITLKAIAANTSSSVNYSWDMGNGEVKSTITPTLNYTYSIPGSYLVKVSVTDEMGCIVTCSSTVTVTRPAPIVNVPNIFTPNGDGKNDTFIIANYTLDEPVLMRIYNRWGKQVAAIENGINGWDGNGCPEGIYYYHITMAGTDKKGWVELVR